MILRQRVACWNQSTGSLANGFWGCQALVAADLRHSSIWIWKKQLDLNSWFQWEALYADQPWESCWATPKLLSNGEIQLLQHLGSENLQKLDAVCKVVLCFLHMPFSPPFFFFFCFIDVKEDRQEEERRELSLLSFYLSLFTSVNSWSQITDRWPSDGIISVWGNLTALEKSMQLFLKKSFDKNFVVWSLSHVWLFGTPWTATHLVSLFFTISQCLLKLCYLAISTFAAPFSLAFSLSQYQGLFQWVGSLHQMAKGLELQLHHHSFQ